MWYYDTKIGRIFIKPISGKYYFQFNGKDYMGHSSAKILADYVCCFMTGCNEWDSYGLNANPEDIPNDLSAWTKCR